MSDKLASWATPVILAGVAVYCWVQWDRTSDAAALLAADPVVAEAMIMEKTHHSGSRHRYGGFPDRYGVIVRFDVQGGDRTSAATRVSERLFKTLKVGDMVAVRYARSNPLIAEIEPGTLDSAAKLYLVGAMVLSALVLLIGVLVAVYRFAMAQARRPQPR